MPARTPADAKPTGSTDLRAARRRGLPFVLFLSVFAFLLAAFPARNSDIWSHLAAGKRLVQQQTLVDSTNTVSLETRINPTWLCDLISYGLYTQIGGAGLVLLKVLLVVGLALVLVRLSHSDQGSWIATASIGLALLTMGLRFLLQPATVSYLLLALTLWFVRPRTESGANRSTSMFPRWPLLVLFALWVNIDGSFVLGLATVALVWLGRVLDAFKSGQPSVASALGRVLVSVSILVAVCLVNPAHVHAFALPPEISWFDSSGASVFSSASGQVMSPFQSSYITGIGWSPAGLAYFPLLGLGLISFILNMPRWHWERFLPWLALALLSALQVRAVPFFAIVAGPVLAWNLQEFFAARTASRGASIDRIGRFAVVFARLSAVVLGVAFLACAWPGWLQGAPFEPRRWAVELPPSLERGASTIRRWYEEGKLAPDARGLHLSAETAAAFAWFCPDAKIVRDPELAAAIQGTAPAPGDWAERMRSAGVNHVVVYDPNRGRLFAILDLLLADAEQWPLLYLEGDLAVFGWRDPARAGRPDAFRGLELDLDRLAYHPADDRKAPRKGPAREPEARRWWEAFWKRTPPRALDRDEATLFLLHAEALWRSALPRHLSSWETSHAAAIVGASPGWTGPGGLVDAHVRLAMLRPTMSQQGAGVEPIDRLALAAQPRFSFGRDDTPPALLYLAIRAARRALAVNPDDAQAHLILGESYLHLLHGTRERAWGKRMPELAQLRRAQATTALNQAVSLKPDLAQAHLNLSGLYQEMGYLDLALDHMRTYVKLGNEARPSSGITAQRSGAFNVQHEKTLSTLGKEVNERRNTYSAESAGMKVGDRAALAFRMGLAGQALDELKATDVAAFGSEGMRLELELLLRTGQAKDVREWLSSEHKAALGTLSYHWLRVQALAASGDYALAEEECEELASAGRGLERVRPLRGMAILIGQAVLNEQPVGASLPDLLLRADARLKLYDRAAVLAETFRRDANATVLRGLLLLEQGDVDEAEVAFRLALTLWQDEATATSGGGLDFKGRVIAQSCLEWLK